MSRIFLALLGMVPANPENSLPVAQEWLFKFGGEGKSSPNPWQQLREVVDKVGEQELMRALDWMSERHIINVRDEGQSLYLTIRNVIAITAGSDTTEGSLEN